MSNIINRDTIGDMARRAATKYGDKTAIIFRDQTLSFYDLERESRRFAHLMTKYGVKKGDRVALYAYNSHYYPISMIGLAKIGAIQVPINFMLNAEEIAALPLLCRGSALRFLLTRLYDWLSVPPGALVTPKNPLEYLAKLRFHRSAADASAYGFVA